LSGGKFENVNVFSGNHLVNPVSIRVVEFIIH
jgi:hypothetical protein